MRKILYFCPVDWDWIKQRPQFLAEELANYYDVCAIYPRRNNRKGLQNNRKTRVKLKPCFSIPTLRGRIPFSKRINDGLSRIQIGKVIEKFKPDIVWLSLPWQYDYLPQGLNCKMVYDCMDDYVAIITDRKPEEILVWESKVIKSADVVFASSENLRRVLHERIGIEINSIHLLRNGYNADWNSYHQDRKVCKKENSRIKIGYFGTVGRWFDFDLLIDSLQIYKQIEYHIFGPIEKGVHIPEHERILYRGVVQHELISNNAVEMDALVMPFVVNDIVRSVDPVKLYEYIWLGKNIICAKYPEIERFDPFVMFYLNKEDYGTQIERIIADMDVKYTHEQAVAFLTENTWKKRAKTASEEIEIMWQKRRD